MDLLVGGWADDIGRQKTYVFANNDTDNNLSFDDFSEITMLGDAYLPGLSEQKYKVGDLNDDYILDYVWFGFKGGASDYPPVGVVDSNIGGWTPDVNVDNLIKPFEQLSAPVNLSVNQTVDGNYVDVTFEWGVPANIATKKSVTYNLSLKNTDTGKWLYNPMAFIGGEKDGRRKVSKMGNTNLRKKWTLKLPQGNYEWTVQAVDAGFFGGKFASVQPLSVSTGLNNEIVFKPSIVLSNGNLIIRYNG